MRIHATILEGTLFALLAPLSYAEVLARNFLQMISVVLQELFLLILVAGEHFRGNDQVARLTANGASAEVMLRRALVIRGSPRSDAL